MDYWKSGRRTDSNLRGVVGGRYACYSQIDRQVTVGSVQRPAAHRGQKQIPAQCSRKGLNEGKGLIPAVRALWADRFLLFGVLRLCKSIVFVLV